jgi:predicted RNase H-like HicB family nuclease
MSKQTVHVVVYKDAESDQWVAQCLEYDVATQGDNESHALEMIREAVELHIEDSSKEELEMLHQPIEGAPKVHEISINAPSLLRT